MTKRLFSLFLTAALLFSLVPAALADDIEIVGEDEISIVEIPEEPTAEADGAGQVAAKLAAVLEQYPDGSSWTDSFDGAIQCYGFAGLVINRVFGAAGWQNRWWTYDGANKAGMVTVGQITDCTESSVKALLSKARPGDVLQFDRGPNGHQHSMIIYDLTYKENEVTGATIYECNWYSYCQVSLRTLTNYQISLRQACADGTLRAGLSLLSSDNWEAVNGGPYTPPYVPVEPSTLALSGECFPSGHYDRLSSFDLKGVFASNYTITRIYGSITDSQGNIVFVYDTPWSRQKYNIQSDGLNYAFRFGALPKNDVYDFYVCATDSSGQSLEAGSSFEIGSAPVPSAPTLSASLSTRGAALSWDAVSGAEYELQRAVDGVWGSPLMPGDCAWTDADVQMGVAYQYRVRAGVGRLWSKYGELELVFNPFSDVPADGKTMEYVSWAYNNGVIRGTTETTFSPENSCSRIQFIMMLWKMHGSPAATGNNPFSDVSGAKTTEAVLWALHRGLINSAAAFYPDEDISRIQIVMILWKLAGCPETEGELPFRDISGAKTTSAVLWAYQNGITRGVSSRSFAPKQPCTRLQLVVFLYKYNAVYGVI